MRPVPDLASSSHMSSSQSTTNKPLIIHNQRCRICERKSLLKFLSLGNVPLVNSFISKAHLNSKEHRYPLDVYFCTYCNLVQLVDVVPKEALFKEYIYYSSMSKTIPLHFVELARDIEAQLKSQKRPLVVEIGSNDGVLLKNIDQSRIRALGVEPAGNIASLAQATGIDTINNFFSKEVAVEIVQSRGQANVIVGCNVVGHIDDLRGLLEAADILLTDDGVFIQVNVGSGLTDDQRETFWAVKDALLGELAEVRADAITQNQDGTYSLRFPRFKTFRGFEVGEKL